MSRWEGNGLQRKETHTIRNGCFIHLKVCRSPPTHTHTHALQVAVLTLLIPFISLFSLFSPPSLLPSFQEQGAGSHLLIGFAEETYSLRLFLPNTPWALLVLDDSPVSCSCQLSRAFTRLVIRRRRVKTAGLQGLRGRERKERGEKKKEKEKHPQTCGAKCQREGSCCLTPA